MKKEVTIFFGIILLIIFSGCTLIISEDKPKETIEVVEEVLQVEEELPMAEHIGPGGCMGEECSKYCRENHEECEKWCQENPDDCPEEYLKPTEGFLGDIPTFIGPGGCEGPACQQYCMQNFQECQIWCEKNPGEDFCQIFSAFTSGGSPFSNFPEEIIGNVADPPSTTITFGKSFNLNAGQFTQQDILEAKELGANMVTFWPIREVRDDEFTQFVLADLPQMIDFVHKNGLQVELRSSITFPELAKDYNKYKPNAIKHASEYAKLAEKYKVYSIIPFAEVDNDLMNHCKKITEFSQTILTEMRKYYSGKIGIGIAAPWRYCDFTFKGYDYLSISAYPHNDLATSINWAREVADKSGIQIVHLGETGVFNPGDNDTPDKFQTLKMSKDEEINYYEDLFVKFSDKVEGFSIFYNSGNVPMGINGDPAEVVVKQWYHKL